MKTWRLEDLIEYVSSDATADVWETDGASEP